MQYNFKEAEKDIYSKWEKDNLFSPKIEKGKKPFSIFLTPPNASGPMHIGNALMVAIQDILVRYHRAKGEPTLWIPCTDHAGYETQVSFERELESTGKSKFDYSDKELFEEIKKFVEHNNIVIKSQIKALGASVDWTRFRFTMDDESVASTIQMFKKMVADNLIYQRLYMVNYCPSCATFLAEIELRSTEKQLPLYCIKFDMKEADGYLSLATTRPEFLFSITHVLVHPDDQQNAHYIGKTLMNPVTGEPVDIVANKRKFDPEKAEPFLTPFSPSYKRYDYGYALHHGLPARNILDWEGKLIERYPGLMPAEARNEEITFLEKNGRIEKVIDFYQDSVLLCKKGHETENLIVFTWFLRLDDEKISLKKPAMKAIEGEGFTVFPRWKKKGLVEWMGKMHDWPIARQNVWGIKIPIWYDVSEPQHFMVWFTNRKGEKMYGNLKNFLETGVALEEVADGLERVYAGEHAKWTLEKEAGKHYLPETDTFDTWFSSGNDQQFFGEPDSDDFRYFYPAESIVIGHDLLRLSVSREILLALYITGRLPFHFVYLHPLLKGQDGQKMSKSLGNAFSLDYFLEKFGADVTRMALISYLSSQEDFYFSEERLVIFEDFSHRIWNLGQQILQVSESHENASSSDETELKMKMDELVGDVGYFIKRYMFAAAQEKVYDFFTMFETYVQENKFSPPVIREVYEKYLVVLHPFMPFVTEAVYGNFQTNLLLAAVPWPGFYFRRVTNPSKK